MDINDILHRMEELDNEQRFLQARYPGPVESKKLAGIPANGATPALQAPMTDVRMAFECERRALAQQYRDLDESFSALAFRLSEHERRSLRRRCVKAVSQPASWIVYSNNSHPAIYRTKLRLLGGTALWGNRPLKAKVAVLPESLAQWFIYDKADSDLPSFLPTTDKLAAVLGQFSPWVFGGGKNKTVRIGDQANVTAKEFVNFEAELEERINGRNEKHSKDSPTVAYRHYYGLAIISDAETEEVIATTFLLPSVLWSHKKKEGIEQKGDLFLLEHLVFAPQLPPPPQKEHLLLEGIKAGRRASGGSVPTHRLVSLLADKLLAYTEMSRIPLEDHCRDHLSKLLGSVSEFPGSVTWQEFAEKTMPWRDEPFAFARWYYDILDQLESSNFLSKLWEKKAIIGFISTEHLRAVMSLPENVGAVGIKWTDSYPGARGLLVWNNGQELREAKFKDFGQGSNCPLTTDKVKESVDFVLCRDLHQRIHVNQVVEDVKTRRKTESTSLLGESSEASEMKKSNNYQSIIQPTLVQKPREPRRGYIEDVEMCAEFGAFVEAETRLREAAFRMQENVDEDAAVAVAKTTLLRSLNASLNELTHQLKAFTPLTPLREPPPYTAMSSPAYPTSPPYTPGRCENFPLSPRPPQPLNHPPPTLSSVRNPYGSADASPMPSPAVHIRQREDSAGEGNGEEAKRSCLQVPPPLYHLSALSPQQPQSQALASSLQGVHLGPPQPHRLLTPSPTPAPMPHVMTQMPPTTTALPQLNDKDLELLNDFFIPQTQPPQPPTPQTPLHSAIASAMQG